MNTLPIDAALPELCAALRTRDEAVLVAPPGAGKTTRVPLALLAEPWLAGRKLLMLEPRRLATRSAAHHMASLLGETPGETVGYRMRLDTQVGPNTRIEVISEGVLTRMLQRDPSLDGVGAVIFDEFHERHVDADLAMSLCLHGRSLFRDADNPLKLLVMSATMDSAAVAELLGAAPLVHSAGRQFPVEIKYGPPAKPRDPLVPRVVAVVLDALTSHPDSSILVFLPGQAEIRRAAEQLAPRLTERGITGVQVHPLYGQLSMDAQQRAIAPPADPGQRKVVLATNIAETSLTIEGIHVVVDSGVARGPVFDPGTGMTRLQDQRISRASSEQRAGRAGRLAPGYAYRLWSADQQQVLAAHTAPEILSADLAPVALQLLHWGVNNPAELSWLDPPPAGPWQQAVDLLQRLGALEVADAGPTLNRHGRLLTDLAVHPRLGHLLLRGYAMGYPRQAALLAAVLADGRQHDEPDLGHVIAMAGGSARCPPSLQGWKRRVDKLARRFATQVQRAAPTPDPVGLHTDQVPGCLLALAYPDRIARRGDGQQYQLANGRRAVLAPDAPLVNADWLAVAEASGRAGSQIDVIRSACVLDPALFDAALAELTITRSHAGWDPRSNRFIAEQRGEIGALVLWRKPLTDVPPEARQQAIVDHIRATGIDVLPWTPALRQWQHRVQLLHRLDPDWPDVSDAALLERLPDWLWPWLDRVTNLGDIRRLDLASILAAQLPWALANQLDTQAPQRVAVPSGSNIRLDYTQDPPVLAVKLQEMFGCQETPRIAGGRVQVVVHLLSPAGRPLQVTQDLAGFWRTSYQDVRRDMRGRYPKHPWPEDPLQAPATARTKRRHPGSPGRSDR